MSNSESTVLARELARLGGGGAGWVGKLLPSVAFEKELELPGDASSVARLIARLVASLGHEIPELPCQPESGNFTFLMGGGAAGLNPTIVRFQIEPLNSSTRVKVRAVAKEGWVKQRTAERAVEQIQSLLVTHPA